MARNGIDVDCTYEMGKQYTDSKNYVAREMYGELGVEDYLTFYNSSSESIELCHSVGGLFDLICPPLASDVTVSMATQHLLSHADNTFSSVTTAGAPFPFWSEGDGTGVLFVPNEETGTLLPVSGSGVNMSAPIDSMQRYFGYLYFSGRELDPSSRQWNDMVEVIRGGFQKGNPVESLCHAIATCGHVLAESFPSTPDEANPNELPNELIQDS